MSEATARILPDLSAEATIAALRAQIEAMKIAAQSKLTMKVTEARLDPKSGQMKGTNGAIAIYGLGRFPVTLYASQWERLLKHGAAIDAFMKANADKLATKD